MRGFSVNIIVVVLTFLWCFLYKNVLRRGSLTFKLFDFYFNLFYILLIFMAVPIFSPEFFTMNKVDCERKFLWSNPINI